MRCSVLVAEVSPGRDEDALAFAVGEENLDSAALQFGAIILPPSKSLHAVAPEVSISELVWSMDPDCRHARPGLRRAPSFTDSFAWVSG